MKALGFLTICLVLATSWTGEGAPGDSWEDAQQDGTFVRDLGRANNTTTGTWICHVNSYTKKSEHKLKLVS